MALERKDVLKGIERYSKARDAYMGRREVGALLRAMFQTALEVAECRIALKCLMVSLTQAFIGQVLRAVSACQPGAHRVTARRGEAQSQETVRDPPGVRASEGDVSGDRSCVRGGGVCCGGGRACDAPTAEKVGREGRHCDDAGGCPSACGVYGVADK